MEAIHQEIKEWFEAGADFDRGITLLQKVSRNHYYIKNIIRARRASTLQYELGKVLSRSGVVKGLPVVGGKKVKPPVKKLPEGVRPPQVLVGIEKSGEEKPFVLREYFPFLDAKDCPDELKILVNEMLTSHKEYVAGHARLFQVGHKGNTLCFETAKALDESYRENRSIWAELEYYKKHNKLLGKHPVFEKRKKELFLYSLTKEELLSRKKNLQRQVLYRKNLIKNKKATDVYQREKELGEIKSELKTLRKILEFKNGKS